MALLNDLNILPFQERVAKLLKGKNGFKALNGLLPSYIAKTFEDSAKWIPEKQETVKEI